MNIAVTARGSEPSSSVDERFGRAYWILFYDTETGAWTAFDNSKARHAAQGAGIEAARLMVERGVEVVLTGVTGPKAFRALDAAGIRVFHGIRGTAAEAVAAWQDGSLERATAESALGTP